MDVDVLQRQWEQSLGQQGQVANNYAQNVALGQTVGQQQIKQGVADAQRKLAAQARATGNPGAQRAAAFGAGNMASAAIGQGAQMSAEEQARAAQMQLQAAQSQSQGYAGAADWQQQRDNAALNFMGNIFGATAGAAGGAAMMMSDENRKRAIDHLEAGDADKALEALKGGTVDREKAMREQEQMDRFIDARIRASGRDPYAMSDADHEREAVRIMVTPEGRRWRPGAADEKVEALGRDLGALDADTSRKMRYADIPLGREAAPAPRYTAPLGALPPVQVDTRDAYAPPPGSFRVSPQPTPMPGTAPAPQRRVAAPLVTRGMPDTLPSGEWMGRGSTAKLADMPAQPRGLASAIADAGRIDSGIDADEAARQRYAAALANAGNREGWR